MGKLWPDWVVVEFMNILYDRVKQHPIGQLVFRSFEWNEIKLELKGKTSLDYTLNQLVGKYNRLKNQYKCFMELLGHTGVTFNAETNTANAPTEIWQKFFMIHKDYKMLHKDGCKYFQQLELVFGRSTAT